MDAAESHWQQGCNDAKERKPRRLPHPSTGLGYVAGRAAFLRRLTNQGYANGYAFGKTRHTALEDEGSRAD
jgi:hypothetical protein